MPSKSRVTLFGHFSILNITDHPEQADQAARCYLDHHPDASHWAPNSTESPHIPFWATFHVTKVYWVGGFGDEHYIGWFNSDEWNAAWKEHRPLRHDTPLIRESEFFAAGIDQSGPISDPSVFSHEPEGQDILGSEHPKLVFQRLYYSEEAQFHFTKAMLLNKSMLWNNASFGSTGVCQMIIRSRLG